MARPGQDLSGEDRLHSVSVTGLALSELDKMSASMGNTDMLSQSRDTRSGCILEVLIPVIVPLGLRLLSVAPTFGHMPRAID